MNEKCEKSNIVNVKRDKDKPEKVLKKAYKTRYNTSSVYQEYDLIYENISSGLGWKVNRVEFFLIFQ